MKAGENKVFINVHKVPFSRFGSYFVISHLVDSKNHTEGLYLRLVRGGDETLGALFRIETLYQDVSVAYQCEATPTVLRLITEYGNAEWCIAEPTEVHVRASGGISLKFVYEPGSYDYAIPSAGNGTEVNSFKHRRRFMFSPIEGKIEVDSSWKGLKSEHMVIVCKPDDLNSVTEFTIEEYESVPNPKVLRTFVENVAVVEASYSSWLERTLHTEDKYSEARELAAYITWSCVVAADGLLTRPAMYMSKNWMTNIWSWDHCFNAMALSQSQPELAWDQFMIFFDRQDASGLLPDFLNDQYALWNCCKPPIHGWTLRWILANSNFITNLHLEQVYEPLIRWTQWWLTYRDHDADGIPQYNHGNDSGWDNSTIFHAAIPVESPDLSAFLIIQIEVLAEIAQKIGRDEEARAWSLRGDELLDRMLHHFWREDRFTAMQSGSHDESTGDSLLLFMPIILGKRLPEKVRKVLLTGLKEESRFLTSYGLATESVSSTFYLPDGYWRGPIWAPSTMLLIDGIKSAGDLKLANELMRKFCEMASKSGMSENFNALSGEGLRDPAFTWTSSVFLMLANELYTSSKL